MMEIDCLFCKIIKGDIPSEKVFENESVLGFKDIAPQAKEHFLFIHKNHSSDVYEMCETNINDVQSVFSAIQEFAKIRSFNSSGFRLVTNNGKSAGQTVFHTHFHFLAGEQLGSFGR